MLLKNNNLRKFYLLDDFRNDLDSIAEKLWNTRDRFEDNNFNYVPISDGERKVIQTLIDKDYKYIGCGSARIVLKFPNESDLNSYIVKIARFGNDPVSIGMWQNQNEVSLWNELHTEDYPILPILDWQEPYAKWIVMPYGENIHRKNISEDKMYKIIDSAINKLEDIEKLSQDEFVPQNFVLYEKEPYLADYGSYYREF